MDPTESNDKWLRVAAHLRVDRSKGVAPHKPLLLLVVTELAEQGRLDDPLLPLTGELTFRFLGYWSVVAARRPQKPDIRLPFYHLSSDGVWSPLDADGKPTTERRRAMFARLDASFLACLHDEGFRRQFRRILIAKYFATASERGALYSLIGISEPPEDIVHADAKLFEEAIGIGREARFRLTVVPAYDYTCALTGYRLVTVEAGCIVDAAHIHRFADSRNNDPRNGIALCKNAHWLFDAGLWSLTDDHRVLVSATRFHETGPESYLLAAMAGRRIRLPEDGSYHPDRTHLAWHRRQHGFVTNEESY